MTHARILFKVMGGKLTSMGDKKNEIPECIEDVRRFYSKILFLDEYYQGQSKQWLNFWSSIIKNKDELPRRVCLVSASNMNDEGWKNTASSDRMSYFQMEVPTPDEWFSYLTMQAKVRGLLLKKEVVDMMYTILSEKPSWLSMEDRYKDIRVSPRRWEQIIFYLNASLPPISVNVARHLLTSVALNFTNPVTGEKLDEQHDLLMKAVTRLVNDSVARMCISKAKYNQLSEDEKKTNIICYEVGEKEQVGQKDWAKVLKHQLVRKQNLGNQGKHITTLSGPFGIGKKTVAKEVSHGFGLGYIYIDCCGLSYEDILGLPISAQHVKSILKDAMGDDETTTDLKLKKALINGDACCYFVQSRVCQAIKMRAEESPPANKNKEKNWYQYLIFLDNFNRVNDQRAFNALRKLILEKKFDNGEKLPPGSIFLAAMDPEDGYGVQDLTLHMKDVMDIIPCLPSWQRQVEYMEMIVPEDIVDPDDEFPIRFPEIMPQIISAIESINLAFMDENFTGEGDPRFQVRIGENSIYCSPREYFYFVSLT